MAFDPIRSERGQPRVRCICDDCGRDEVVAAMHGKDGCEGQGKAVAKVQKLGWSFIGKRLRCSSCEAKRKVGKMAKAKAVKPDVAPPREPTRAQKREIMDMLDEVYDVDAECYRRGDTDETVADVLNVMPGWVSQLREEFFGPTGSNEDMAALRDHVEALIANGERCIQKLQTDGIAPLVKAIEDAKAVRERLVKIEQAVGPRVMARAK